MVKTSEEARIALIAQKAIVEDKLERLEFLHLRAQTIQGDIDHLVVELRMGGASWGSIATRLGISAQAAHQRWSPTGKEKHRIRQLERTKSKEEAGESR